MIKLKALPTDKHILSFASAAEGRKAVDDATWALVTQARAADTAAITTLYERYSEGLYRYVLWVSGDNVLAEDLTEQAFLRWLDGTRRLVHPPTTARAALYRGAHDLLTLHAQTWRRSTGYEVPAAPAAGDEALSRTDAAEGFWDQFQAALARLSEMPIQVLALKIGASLSTAEVAWILGCREDEIKQAQFQALDHLRQWLAGTSAALPLEEQG